MKTVNKILKWIFRIITSILLLWIIAMAVIVLFVIPRTDFESIVKQEIDEVIQVKNGYSNADFTFFQTFPYVSLVIDDAYLIDTVKVPNDTILTFDKLQINFNLYSTLVEKKLSFRKIEVLKPHIHYCIDSIGTSNLDGIVSLKETSSQDDSKPIIYLNDLRIKDLSIKYENSMTKKVADIDDFSLSFQGRVNTRDSILDIREGEISLKGNSIRTEGYIMKNDINLDLSYSIKDLSKFESLIEEYTNNEELKKYKVTGNYQGNVSINGQPNDTAQNSLKLKGSIIGENINIVSSSKDKIIKEGCLNIEFAHDMAHLDSLYVGIKAFNISGDNIYLDLNGNVTHSNDDFYIDANINSKGNLTKLAAQNRELTKNRIIRGKFDVYVNVSSSLNDLQHKYSFPKSINNISRKIVIPEIYGQVDLHNIYYKDNTREISSNKIKLFVDGSKKKVIANSEISDIRYKETNLYVAANGTVVSLDGNTLIAKANVDQIGYMGIKDNDTITIQSDKINLDFSPKNKNIANGFIEKITASKGDANIFGAKIFLNLHKNNLKNKENLWDAITGRAFIVTAKNNSGQNVYGKILKGDCKYEKALSDVHLSSDTIDVKAPGNELFVSNLNLSYDGKDCLDLTTGHTASRELDFGIGLDVKSLNANYNNKNISVSSGPIKLGKSDINVNGTISLVNKDKPKIRIKINGQNLDLNEIVYAQNVHALATGNPYAVPLDSIPKNTLPRSIGNENSDIILDLDLKRLGVSSLNLNNTTGKIIIKGTKTLLDNLTSRKGNNAFTLTSLLRYVNPYYSESTVKINAINMDMNRLFEIIPGIDEVSPMLSALKGTIDFSIGMSSSFSNIIQFDMGKSKVAATLEAKNLSISDNEEFAKIAKTLMFKNKERTDIDSLAVAATINNGDVNILPFMLKVDRYKVALTGNSNISSGKIDYHISVLKSPVPFKFGINITGSESPYKIKLEKTMNKTINPSIKPWTDEGFTSYSKNIIKPITDF